MPTLFFVIFVVDPFRAGGQPHQRFSPRRARRNRSGQRDATHWGSPTSGV